MIVETSIVLLYKVAPSGKSILKLGDTTLLATNWSSSVVYEFATHVSL